MSSVINTNITSLISQQNLGKSQNSLATAMERLSSGMRINSAKDDAAGQAIANRMSAQITGLATAQRNANDGISVAQTAEGALDQINDNLQRVRELTVQAQNDTNNSSDLESIQAEIDQRLSEIDRISAETDFNGTKVLAEDNANFSIQVGANDSEVISIGLQKITTETLFAGASTVGTFDVSGTKEIENTAATADNLDLLGFEASGAANSNGSVTWEKTTDNTAATSDDVFAALQAAGSGEITYAGTDNDFGVASTGTYKLTEDGDFTYNVTGASGDTVAALLTPSAAGDFTTATVTLSGGSQEVKIDSDGNMFAADDDSILYLDGDGNLTKTNASGGSVQATISNFISGTSFSGSSVSAVIQVGDTTYTSDGAGAVNVSGATMTAAQMQGMVDSQTAQDYTVSFSGSAIDYNVQRTGTGDVSGSVGGTIYMDIDGELAASGASLTTVYVQESGLVTDDTGRTAYMNQAGDDITFNATTTGTATEDPLETLDAALAMVDSLRSDLGAVQNRFEAAIENLSTNETNLSAARSRIEDADYAVEVANMTRAQILQQAGTSVLAQANQIPQNVLSLLG